MLSSSKIAFRINLLYFLCWGFFFFTKNLQQPAWFDTLLQLLMLFVGCFFVLFNLRIKTGPLTWVSIFLYHICFAFLMRYFNIEFYDSPFGANPVDAALYESLGNRFGGGPYSSLSAYLDFNGYKIDDFGFPLIIWIAASLFGKSWIDWMVILNGVALALGSSLLYKLSLQFVNRSYSKLLSLLWGIMPYAIFTSARGLKENFFALSVICTFYFFYRYVYQNKRESIICFVISLFSLFLFRLAVGYFAILSIVSYYVLQYNFIKRHLKWCIFILLVCLVPLFPIVTSSILEQRGYDYENVTASKEAKTEATGGVVASVTNVVAGFVGPIPNFITSDAFKRTYITRYSLTTFIKIVISFFFLYGLYSIVKKRQDLGAVPLFVFIILNIIMMIFTFYTLHDRYHWPAIPLFLIVSAWGYMRACECGSQSLRLYKSYVVGVILLIIIFNFR